MRVIAQRHPVRWGMMLATAAAMGVGTLILEEEYGIIEWERVRQDGVFTQSGFWYWRMAGNPHCPPGGNFGSPGAAFSSCLGVSQIGCPVSGGCGPWSISAMTIDGNSAQALLRRQVCITDAEGNRDCNTQTGGLTANRRFAGVHETQPDWWNQPERIPVEDEQIGTLILEHPDAFLEGMLDYFDNLYQNQPEIWPEAHQIARQLQQAGEAVLAGTATPSQQQEWDHNVVPAPGPNPDPDPDPSPDPDPDPAPAPDPETPVNPNPDDPEAGTTPDPAQFPDQCELAFQTLCDIRDFLFDIPENFDMYDGEFIEDLTAQDLEGTWSSGLGTGSCPSPRTISIGGQNLQFTYDTVCQVAGWFRAILLLSVSFLAAGIILGVRA